MTFGNGPHVRGGGWTHVRGGCTWCNMKFISNLFHRCVIFLNMFKLISNVFQIPQAATSLAWVNFPTIIRLHGGAAVSQTGTTSENHTHVRGRGSKPCFDFIMYFFFCCLAWRLPPFFVRGQLLCASLWLLVDLELAHRLNQTLIGWWLVWRFVAFGLHRFLLAAHLCSLPENGPMCWCGGFLPVKPGSQTAVFFFIVRVTAQPPLDAVR